jgi:hypothetical protein
MSNRTSARIVAIVLALSTVAACESLLEVDIPGNITEAELDDPILAPELVGSTVAAFDCMVGTYIEEVGRWAKDFYYMNTGSGFIYTQTRTTEVQDFEQVDCTQTGVTRSAAVWLPLSTVIRQGEQASTIIGEFADSQVDNRTFLLAKAAAYTGYAYQIAGETFCELAFDGGPSETREQAWLRAQAKFTEAISLAGSATSAPSGDAVADILDMAYVGRARSRLHLADAAGVLADAGKVTTNFIRYAEMDGGTTRRSNRVFENNNRDEGTSVHPSYLNLTVGGVPDPRVSADSLGIIASDAVTQVWTQNKFADLGADIPFATWREAQLMIAEVDPTQSVAIINNLRATPHGLAAYGGGTATEIMETVLEERRRELWMQGTKLGDMLRVQARADLPDIAGYMFETGLNQRGQAYGPGTCYPLPLSEKENNPNF